MKNLKVLCLGYNEMERQRLSFLFHGVDFEGHSYYLDHQHSFQSATENFMSKHPDLILIHDSFKKGLAFCRFIRSFEGQRHTGIIFTTQKSDFIEVSESESLISVECLERGADDFIRLNTFNKEFMARVRSIVRLKMMTDELRLANHQLRILSLTDDLTGLANMRSFYNTYNQMIRHLRGSSFHLGILMFDLDHFKKVNDKSSHLVGSKVLSEVGQLVLAKTQQHKDGFAARFGGDEFIICLKVGNQSDLEQFGEDLRLDIQKKEFNKIEEAVKITASFGGVFLEKGFDQTSNLPLKVADANLYHCKDGGRNRVYVTKFDRNKSACLNENEQHSIHMVFDKKKKAV